jgi:hypothetical protein
MTPVEGEATALRVGVPAAKVVEETEGATKDMCHIHHLHLHKNLNNPREREVVGRTRSALKARY